MAEVAPELVTHDRKRQLSTVRYEAINVMLLNEFLKEHRKVEKLQATVADPEAQLQKLSAQIEMETPAMRLAVESR